MRIERALRQLARPRYHERFLFGLRWDRIAESIERRRCRRADLRSNVGAGDRIRAVYKNAPVLEHLDISGVKVIKPLESKRMGRTQLHAADGPKRSRDGRKVLLDAFESLRE